MSDLPCEQFEIRRADLPPARILDVEPEAYHRLPGFSASLAKIAQRDSIAHAKDSYDAKMERLAEEESDESDGDDEDVSDDKRKRRDLGTIMHALLLGKGKRMEVIPTELLAKNGSYGTKASKALRDEARRAGRVPVKQHDVEIHERRAGSIRAQILAAGHRLDGVSELAIEWHESTPHGPVQCRCMMDHVIAWGWEGDEQRPRIVDILDPEARAAVIYDLKIGVANPRRVERSADDQGHAIQAAAYPRALAALVPWLAGRIEFRFLFCEPARPFAVWDPTLAGTFREIGERRWLRAVRAWGEGLATGHWPAYRTPEHVELSASTWTLRQEGYQPEEF